MADTEIAALKAEIAELTKRIASLEASREHFHQVADTQSQRITLCVDRVRDVEVSNATTIDFQGLHTEQIDHLLEKGDKTHVDLSSLIAQWNKHLENHVKRDNELDHLWAFASKVDESRHRMAEEFHAVFSKTFPQHVDFLIELDKVLKTSPAKD